MGYFPPYSESNLFPFGNSTHSLINRSITSVSNTHVTTVTCCLHARRIRPLGHPLTGIAWPTLSYRISSEATEKLVEPRGIEPRSQACKAHVLPLYRWPLNEMHQFYASL